MTPGNDVARIAIFISFSGEGGVERMILNLAEGLQQAGHAVDLVLVKQQGAHIVAVPAGVRVVPLGARHTFLSIAALVRYLRANRPDVVLAAKDRAIRAAVIARWLARVRFRLVGRLGTTLSAALAGRSPLRTWWRYSGMRLLYPSVDTLVAVSHGVADDVKRIARLDDSRVRVVRNPVWTPRLEVLANEPIDHPWFKSTDLPVIVAAGRLTRQKDFPTLLQAFARVRGTRPCRLVILGEGQWRQALVALAQTLGIAADVDLPGFVANPYAYMARSRLFVLSSAWEGSPNVLTEALALGLPAVATDCPSGPREILDGGRFGPLVPVGDVAALADAMIATLDRPLPPDVLRQAAQPYRLSNSTRGYLAALGLAT